MIACRLAAGMSPLVGIGLGVPCTARTLIRSLAETIEQSVLRFTPPLAVDALWQLTQFDWIKERTAVNKGPAALVATEIDPCVPVQPFASLAVMVYVPVFKFANVAVL